ncbi:MAG TPA: M1 family metallopeptidase [Gemmatimonadales bacterium]|nr:M1 family metallopeptidase [Gemmatimonadales bacterium]
MAARVAAADSQPAPGYFQQRVAYRINASLDEPSGVLTGHVRITYVNQSPDTLRDFYVHQYLNAFRPGSRWSASDSAEHVERFQHLKDPDYGFERITAATVMGDSARPDYPFAPDSTVAHWPLARPLAPGDSMLVEIDWQARPSTLPRRQGRQGRRFDFAEWYPKVVVYDKYGWEAHALYPAGEFYGEFGTFDVTLDLAADQVIGATGVPVCGDPGWRPEAGNLLTAVTYQRDYYPDAPHDCPAAAPGRKTVRFYAEQVHHFAFSLNPQYRYEEGRYKDVVVHVLYQPGDEATWGHGVAVRNTVTALAWLDSLYGKFEWPQMTNVHRIEGGGTEFPMMVMNGGASLGLITHEVGHNYTMGILANNEWKEGFLDEGFTSFQTEWYFETHGAGTAGYHGLESNLLFWDLNRWSEPVSLPSERYRDFLTYNVMIYSKAQLFYDQLRYVVGDAAMRKILRAYYARWKLHHVDEAAFRSVCEEVSHQDLEWLFGQWLHGTPLIDYRLAKVERRRLPSGRWSTTVTIERLGDGMMPVEIGDRDTIYARSTGQPEVERVTFESDRRPGRLMLDPRVVSHDWNLLNNEERGLPWPLSKPRTEVVKVDDPFREASRRDARVSAFLPLLWSNTAGGVTAGFRDRSNYLGSYDRGLFVGSVGTAGAATHRVGFYFSLENPVSGLQPRTTTRFAAWDVEGRAGASLHVDRALRRHLGFGADTHAGVDAMWMATTDLRYLDRGLWSDGGTIELGPWASTATRLGGGTLRARMTLHGGLLYWQPGPGIVSPNRYDIEPYGRATAEASTRQPFWAGTTIGARIFGGAYLGASAPLNQRRIMIAGADPYQTFTNPLVRSLGALLVRPGFYYQSPGDANLRGFRPALGGRWAVAVNAELTRAVWTRPRGVLRSAAIEGFVDAGVVDGRVLVAPPRSPGHVNLYDGGVGVVTRQQVGDLAWTSRFELPLVVSRPANAADRRGAGGRLALRWQLSLAPSF